MTNSTMQTFLEGIPVELEYDWRYTLHSPNGRTLLRTDDPLELEDRIEKFKADAIMLGVDANFTVTRRKRVTVIWIGNEEDVE